MTQVEPETRISERRSGWFAGILHGLRREWPLLVSIAAAVVFVIFGSELMADLANPIRFGGILAFLFAVILLSAFAVVRHAESIAIVLGEPLGTLV
ncbi:MAG TPA: hypothetical protein VKB78_10380, partial [Pirellulales bacterium]|nr:hypothetical protein [Pirellulales bacterium]